VFVKFNEFGELSSFASSTPFATSYTRDKLGRITQKVETIQGITTTTDYVYDLAGRLTGVSENHSEKGTLPFNDKKGVSLVNFTGNVARVSDALNRSTSFAYDVMGRVTSQTLPDGRSIAYSYDNLGNLLSITPPGRNAHVFNYTAVSLEAGYTPPTVAGTGATTYQYNLAKQLTSVIRPDGQALSLAYDAGARLATQTLPCKRGQVLQCNI